MGICTLHPFCPARPGKRKRGKKTKETLHAKKKQNHNLASSSTGDTQDDTVDMTSEDTVESMVMVSDWAVLSLRDSVPSCFLCSFRLRILGLLFTKFGQRDAAWEDSRYRNGIPSTVRRTVVPPGVPARRKARKFSMSVAASLASEVSGLSSGSIT